MMPMVRPPASRAARETEPIMDIWPPPVTNSQPRAAIAVPTSPAKEIYLGSISGDEEQ